MDFRIPVKESLVFSSVQKKQCLFMFLDSAAAFSTGVDCQRLVLSQT